MEGKKEEWTEGRKDGGIQSKKGRGKGRSGEGERSRERGQ